MRTATKPFKYESNTSLAQLKQAVKCYIINLNPDSNSMTSYYSVYTQDESGKLEILWGNYSYNEQDKFVLGLMLPKQKHSNKRKYPAFHFSLHGGQYDKPHELATELRDMSGNPNLEFYLLTGYSPSKIQLNDFIKG